MDRIEKQRILDVIREKQKKITPYILEPKVGSKVRFKEQGFVAIVSDSDFSVCYTDGNNIFFNGTKYHPKDVEVVSDLTFVEILHLIHIFVDKLEKNEVENKKYNLYINMTNNKVYLNIMYKRKNKTKLLFEWNPYFNNLEYQTAKTIKDLQVFLENKNLTELIEMYFNHLNLDRWN